MKNNFEKELEKNRKLILATDKHLKEMIEEVNNIENIYSKEEIGYKTYKKIDELKYSILGCQTDLYDMKNIVYEFCLLKIKLQEFSNSCELNKKHFDLLNHSNALLKISKSFQI